MESLPADIIRHLALMPDNSIVEILHLAQLNRYYYKSICKNQSFWRAFLTQRYRYGQTMSLEQLRLAVIDFCSKSYSVDEGLLVMRRIHWLVGNSEQIQYYNCEITGLNDPRTNAILTKPIDFGRAKTPLYFLGFGIFHITDGSSARDICEIIDECCQSIAFINGTTVIGLLGHTKTSFRGLVPYQDGFRVSFYNE